MLYLKRAALAAAIAMTCGSATVIAQSDAPQADVEQAYVYATIGFGQLKPEMLLDRLGSMVTGTYTATQSEAQLNEIYYTGTYGITSGTLEGEFAGATLSGYWYEPAINAGLQGSCPTKRKGTFVYGRFTLKFSADRKSFTGLRSDCDDVPNAIDHRYYTWNGTLIRRQAATASSAATGSPPAGKASTSARATRQRAKPTSRITDSAARAAEDEINAKAEEAARRATRAILDKAF